MKVVLADDAVLLRQGLARLLTDAGLQVTGEAGDVDTLTGLIADTDPDVVILDIRMPPTHRLEGLEAAAVIRAGRPTQAVLVLSQYVEPHYAATLLAGGAAGLGYLLKDRVTDATELIDAVSRVAAGQTVIDPEIVNAMLTENRRDHRMHAMSNREREVLALMAQGRSNQAIADRLHLTHRTVESHVRAIFNRLDLPPTPDDHRRVLAVLTYLQSQADWC